MSRKLGNQRLLYPADWVSKAPAACDMHTMRVRFRAINHHLDTPMISLCVAVLAELLALAARRLSDLQNNTV